MNEEVTTDREPDGIDRVTDDPGLIDQDARRMLIAAGMTEQQIREIVRHALEVMDDVFGK